MGMRVVLGDGDEIRIGGYALQASFEDDATSATILRGRTMVPTPTVPPRLPPPASPAQSSGLSPALSEVSGTLAEPLRKGRPGESFSDDPHGAYADVLWRAFLQGAGLEASKLPAGPSPQLLSSIGEMLRIAIGGLQRLVTMRARAKNEIQAEMTMMKARDNNPLKFSPDEGLALEMLLKPPARGFLGGPAALRAALADLQAHQVGLTAGMRAVLEAVLDRLDPEKLEDLQEKDKGSVMDSLLPARKHARLWEAYNNQYQSLREEAQDNFQRFFGSTFRDAYEAQVRKLDEPDDTTSFNVGKDKTPQRR
jgi:FHA domain-containing protein